MLAAMLAYFNMFSRLFSQLLHHLATPRWLATCFLVSALPTGLGSALFTPIGMFPDEQTHIVRADGLRYGEFFGRKPPPGTPPLVINAGAMANVGLLSVMYTQEPVALFPAQPAEIAAARNAARSEWGNLAYWPTQMVEYLPVFYVPSALSLLVGEKLGLSPLHTLYLGRVVMLLVFVALGTAALFFARFATPLLFTVLTLPTTVNLASSYNQDGLIIGSCVLAVALLTRGRPGFGPAWLTGLVILSCVICAKTPYAALLVFGVLPLTVAGLRRRVGFTFLAALPPILWLLHIHHFGFIDYQQPPYHPGPLWPGPRGIWLHDVQPRYNLHVLLANPALIILLPVWSFYHLWPQTWQLILGMVGCDHGLLPAWEYPCLLIALGAASLGTMSYRLSGWRWIDTCLAALALFLAFLGMELSLYLTYDTAGADLIIGVESRYFLPFIPFLAFLFASAGERLTRLPGMHYLRSVAPGWYCLPPVALAFANSYALPNYIFHLYHAALP